MRCYKQNTAWMHLFGRTMIQIDDNNKVIIMGTPNSVARAKYMIRIVSEHGIDVLAPGWEEMDVSTMDNIHT